MLAAVAVGLGVVVLTRLGDRLLPWVQRANQALRVLLGRYGPGQALGVALLSGFAEELLFRGALWPHLGIWGTSLLFGLVHVIPKRALLLYPVFAAAVGFVFGLLRSGSGSVLPAMLAHALINGVNLLWLARQPLPGATPRRRARSARWPHRDRGSSTTCASSGCSARRSSARSRSSSTSSSRRSSRPVRGRASSRSSRGPRRPPTRRPPPTRRRGPGRTIFVVGGRGLGRPAGGEVVAAVRARAPGRAPARVRRPRDARRRASTLDRSIVEHAVVGFFAVVASLADLVATLRRGARDLPRRAARRAADRRLPGAQPAARALGEAPRHRDGPPRGAADVGLGELADRRVCVAPSTGCS